MNTIHCPRCGAELAEDVHFCQYCGATVTPQANPQANPQTPPQPQQPYYTGAEQPPYGAYPPGAGPQGMPIPPGYPQKSKIAAGILGILLGSLGVHNFYLGYTSRGLIQLLVSVCTCGIGAFPMWVWGLVEGIQILTGSIVVDAHGVPLGD